MMRRRRIWGLFLSLDERRYIFEAHREARAANAHSDPNRTHLHTYFINGLTNERRIGNDESRGRDIMLTMDEHGGRHIILTIPTKLLFTMYYRRLIVPSHAPPTLYEKKTSHPDTKCQEEEWKVMAIPK